MHYPKFLSLPIIKPEAILATMRMPEEPVDSGVDRLTAAWSRPHQFS
jgi:hypothetical protein